MFKRLRWMTLGALAGAAGSAWARYRLRRVLDRGRPAELGAAASRLAVSVTDEVRAAVADGRAAMHTKEAEMRAVRGLPRPPSDAGGDRARPVLKLVESPSAGTPRRWVRPRR